MITLFDIALFLRENARSLKISPMQKIVLFAIAGRIGNNKDTWLKQATLAQECDIGVRHLRTQLRELSDKNLISTEVKGRNNRYSFGERLLNYNPKTIDAVTPVTVEYSPQYVHIPPDESPPEYIDQPLEMRHCSSGEWEEYGNYSSYEFADSGTAVPILFDEKNAAGRATSGLQETEILPKQTLKQTDNKIKQTKMDEKIEIPEWLNPTHWEEFLEFRASLKAGMSLLAQKKAIKALSRLRDEGNDVSEVIDQSIVSGWRGLFPVRKSAQSKTQNTQTYLDIIKQEYKDALANEARKAGMANETIPYVLPYVPSLVGCVVG